MVFDEPQQPVKPEIVLGEDLSLHSLEELEARIEALKARSPESNPCLPKSSRVAALPRRSSSAEPPAAEVSLSF
jgi:hypothetical protein